MWIMGLPGITSERSARAIQSGINRYFQERAVKFPYWMPF